MNLYQEPVRYANLLDNPIYADFFKTLYTTNISGSVGGLYLDAGGIPDISGYILIYIQPPILSGLFNPWNVGASATSTAGLGSDSGVFGGGALGANLQTYGHQTFNPPLYAHFLENSKNTLLLAQDISPPELQIVTNDMASTVNIKMPYGVGKVSGGNVTISYLENATLDIYLLHHTWVHYIEDVILGQVNPTDMYIQNYMLDYATCIYILKYKPDMQSLTYFGKAVGVFPISVPTKEVIGTRNSYQTTVYTISYVCTDYQDLVMRTDTSNTPAILVPPGANTRLVEDIMIIYALFGLI